MSTRLSLILALACSLLCADEKTAAKDEPILQDQKAKDSYAVGMQVGAKLKGASLGLDAELVSRGLRDAMTGGTTLLTEAEMNASLQSLRADFKTKQVEALEVLAGKNKKEGEAFLAENKTREGVITLESGLQYKVLKTGDGKKPSEGDSVVCHYRGTLIDGTEFDSSYKRRKPATLPLKSIIPGWREALQFMPVGSKWQLYIPSNLAYGESGQRWRGKGKTIGPNTALVFEVELLSIQEGVKNTSAAAGKVDSAGPSLTGIQVSFKLDPRILSGVYGGERWVSPPKYTTSLDTVEARVAGVGPKGSVPNLSAKWLPSDPEIVTVSPAEGSEVKIAVRKPGQTTVLVSSNGVSKELAINAALKDNAMQVEISQAR